MIAIHVDNYNAPIVVNKMLNIAPTAGVRILSVILNTIKNIKIKNPFEYTL